VLASREERAPESRAMGPDGLKECPTCAKFVRHEVIKCPYCAADFPAIDSAPTINLAKARTINNIVIVAILVISAVAVLVSLWR
jgi:hypothetical protein